ncbi:Phosphoheptose isomerase 1 [Campylobacter coli]|nr:Phosphoheptose isomerase 1 [Campylobacter coli]
MARTSKVAKASEILKGQIAKVGELLCECLKKVEKF